MKFDFLRSEVKELITEGLDDLLMAKKTCLLGLKYLKQERGFEREAKMIQ